MEPLSPTPPKFEVEERSVRFFETLCGRFLWGADLQHPNALATQLPTTAFGIEVDCGRAVTLFMMSRFAVTQRPPPLLMSDESSQLVRSVSFRFLFVVRPAPPNFNVEVNRDCKFRRAFCEQKFATSKTKTINIEIWGAGCQS